MVLVPPTPPASVPKAELPAAAPPPPKSAEAPCLTSIPVPELIILPSIPPPPPAPVPSTLPITELTTPGDRLRDRCHDGLDDRPQHQSLKQVDYGVLEVLGKPLTVLEAAEDGVG